MRSLIGFVLFNGLALTLGLSTLVAVGLARRRLADLVAAAPAALLCGLALIGLGALLALITGLGLDLAVLTAVVLSATAVLTLVGWRRTARERFLPAERRLPPALMWAPPAVVVAFIVVQILSSRHVPIAWDAAHIWSLKALALTSHGTLEGQLFTGAAAFPAAHLDYPLLQPVLGALAFRFAAAGQQGVLLGELWLILGATVLAVPWLTAAGRWTWLALAPMVLAMTSGPAAGLLRGDADVAMACWLAVGCVALIRALESRRPAYAVLAALWLGAAANTKNEGMAFAFAVIVVVGVAALWPPRRSLAPVGVAVAGGALLVAPWRLWVAAHGPFVSDVAPLSDSLDLGYLADRLPQLDQGAQALLGHFAEGPYYWLVPAVAAVAVAAIASRRSAGLAAIYLAAVLASVLAVLWVYWISQQPDVAGHIIRTSIRTVTGPLFLAAAALAHLLPRLLDGVALLGPVDPRGAEVGGSEAQRSEPALSR